jgi:protein TonB
MIFGLPLAAAITAGLFVMMSAMIRQDPTLLPPAPPFDPEILATIPEPEARSRTRPDPRERIEPPPPVDKKWIEKEPRPGGGGGGVIPGGEPKDFDLPPVGFARPIIKVPPAYPEQCRSAGAEGTVIVQFDVTDAGEVVNVRIISSAHRCFDRAVIKAVSGWKYPAERRVGVTETLTFQLEG